MSDSDTTTNVKTKKKGSRSWIYKLSKPLLHEKLEELSINYDEEATVDDLRKLLSTYCKQQSSASSTAAGSKLESITKTTMTSYDLKQFEGENWEVFEQQLECIITLNEVTEDKKVSLLVTKLSPKVFETLADICGPVKPVKKTYQELCNILKEKYCQQQSSFLERSIFRKRNQLQNETIEDYVTALRKLAKRCDFKDMADQIKDKFIDGAHSKLVKFELLKNSQKLSLEETIQLARTVETALLNTNEDPIQSEVFQNVQRNNSNNRRYKTNYPKVEQNRVEKKCFCCGKNNHLQSECSLKFKYCSECGQQGHIFRMCKKKGSQPQRDLLMIEGNAENSEDKKPENNSTTNEEYQMYSLHRVSRIPPYYLNMNLEGKNIQFQLDTGSEVTVISLKDKNCYFPNKNIETCNVIFKNFDQSESKPLGIIKNITVRCNNKTQHLNLFVSQNNSPRIIGRDWLYQLNLWPPNILGTNVLSTNEMNMCNNNVSGLKQEIKDKFAEVFSPGWGNFRGETISLKLKPDVKPRSLPVRRVPYALKDKVKHEINRLLINGRIQPVEHSQWGTPVVPILKPDGTVRLCGDYKLTVNPHLEVDHFPLPHVDDIFDSLKNGKYFCELDLKEAYLQAKLDEVSQDCTVIVTEVGTFKYLYLPYGVSTGPGSFQRLMCKKLANIPNTAIFIDNIYISGCDLQDTMNTLCMVLKKLRECEFKLKLEKCKFFTESIDVFGFRIDESGINVIKSNIEPLLKAKPPTNLTMLKSFLGKINYYSRFLKDMSTIIAPLYDCTKKNNFCWTEECDKSFESIKAKLSHVDNLRHYDPNLPLILTCDASDKGLGAVISNRDKNGEIKPIAYASKKLNAAEQRYSAIDKEAMAIVFGVTKFYNYTYGRPFELETDSAALVRIFGPTKSIPKMAAKRLQHYAIFLSAFNYKIKHIKTNCNPADFLSRSLQTDEDDKLELHSLCLSGNESYCNYVNNSKIDGLDWKIIQKETSKDPLLSQIIRYTYDGWPEKHLILKENLPFYNRKEEISVDRSCLFWGHRILIPSSLQESILGELHKSHFGIVRMKEIARSYFWWPGLDSEIEQITKNCLTCLRNRKNPQKDDLKPWPVPPTAWYRIHADFAGPFYNKMFLIVVDSYSKWPEVFEMTSITSTKTIDIFKQLFARFGFPVQLVTDNAPTFTSEEFRIFCKLAHIKHTFSPPYHPATNGAAERFVETFKSHTMKIKESGLTLSSALNLFLSDYRSTPQRTTGITPAKLMLGRELRNRFSLLRPPPFSEKFYEMREKIKQNHPGNRNITLIVGQKVMVRDYRKGNKPWIQGIITGESIPGVTYSVDVNGSSWKRHIDQILTCSDSLNE